MNYSRRQYLLGSVASILALQTAGAKPLNSMSAPTPPVAERRPYSYSRHGYMIEDPYHWLKDESYPNVDDKDVLAYLNAENGYFEEKMRPHQALVETLFQEMKARLKEDDASVPQKDGDWEYWWEYRPGAQYRRWLRRPVSVLVFRACLRARHRARVRSRARSRLRGSRGRGRSGGLGRT